MEEEDDGEEEVGIVDIHQEPDSDDAHGEPLLGDVDMEVPPRDNPVKLRALDPTRYFRKKKKTI